MRIISWNVNGIRAVERKGELDNLLNQYDPDVFLVQETKASPDKLTKKLKQNDDYYQYYCSAEKAGYSGTSIWLKKQAFDEPEPDWHTGMPAYDDQEGRIIRVDLEKWTILSIYFPNGGKSDDAWQDKLVFYDRFLDYMNDLRAQGRHVIWAGDVNCAHEEIDIARPKENQNSIGFLPEERAWVTQVVSHGWADVFRQQYPDTVMYSWWHLISKARSRNVGWRIDYFFVDEKDFEKVTRIEYLNDQMGSDHCPMLMEIG